MLRLRWAPRVALCVPRLAPSSSCCAALAAARRWQGTQPPSYSDGAVGLDSAMKAKGFRYSTPNFDTAGLSSSDAPSVDPAELAADIITESAVGVDFVRDIYGPWLVMTDDLQGELFIDHDRFVYYRPSNGLGYGIGKVDILDAGATGTAFTLQLESYTYQQTDTVVPQFGLRFDVTGMVKRVTTKSSDYTTFSLVGVWRRVNRNSDTAALLPSQKNREGLREAEEEVAVGEKAARDAAIKTTAAGAAQADAAGSVSTVSHIATGQFNAAKLPIGGAESAVKPFAPNAELQRVFEHVFPTHLRADSHLKRAEERKAALAGHDHLSEGSASSSPLQHHRSSGSKAVSDALHMDLAPYAVGSVPGLYYIPDYISAAEETQMLQFMKDTPNELKSKLTKRTVQEWGCTMCAQCQKSFVSDANMPPWVQEALDMQVHDGLFTPTTFPNSVRVHEYQQGEGIGPHCDGPIYVPMVTVVSLASSCLMSFYPRQGLYDTHPMDHYNDTFKFAEGEIGQRVPLQSVVLEPRSLLIFSGEGYYHYPHGVSDKAYDDLSSDLVGAVVNRHLLRDQSVQSIPRTFRASITTRNLMTRCNHQPERAEYAMKRAWYIYNHLPVPHPLFTDPPAQEQQQQQQLSGRSTRTPISASPLSTAGDRAAQRDGSSSLQSSTHLLAAIEELRVNQEELRSSVEELKQLVMALIPSQKTFQAETATILDVISSTVLELDVKADDILDELARQRDTTKEN